MPGGSWFKKVPLQRHALCPARNKESSLFYKWQQEPGHPTEKEALFHENPVPPQTRDPHSVPVNPTPPESPHGRPQQGIKGPVRDSEWEEAVSTLEELVGHGRLAQAGTIMCQTGHKDQRRRRKFSNGEVGICSRQREHWV